MFAERKSEILFQWTCMSSVMWHVGYRCKKCFYEQEEEKRKDTEIHTLSQSSYFGKTQGTNTLVKYLQDTKAL